MNSKDTNQSPPLLLKKHLCKTTKWIEWKTLWTLIGLKLTLTQEGTHILSNLLEEVELILCHQRGQGWLTILATLTIHPRRLRKVPRWACKILAFLDKEALTLPQSSDQAKALEILELKTIMVNINLIYQAITTNIINKINSHNSITLWVKNKWRFLKSLEERSEPTLKALSQWALVDIHLQMYICKETILKSQLTNIKNNTLNRKLKRIWGWETQTNTNKTLIWMSQSNIIRVGAYKQTLTMKRQQSQII